MVKKFKYIYGPVSSWRLGRSLGIDTVSSARKICNFDCIYCQAGSARPYTGARKIFVSTADIIREIRQLPALKLDYITFSGAGEPTLAKNLGEIIKAVRKIRGEKIAVLTNSSLLEREDVQSDLRLADFVSAKLDVSSQGLFKKINRPYPTIKLSRIIKGIKDFKSKYSGRLGLQIMFTGKNKRQAEKIAAIAQEIGPDEIELNTPLRPCNEKPLPIKTINSIRGYFKGMNVLSVYDAGRKKAKPIDREGVFRRRGSF